MKLELKDLAHYLAYDVRIARFTANDKFKRVEYSLRAGNLQEVVRCDNLKPILRPLSDLTKDIIDEMQESYCFDPTIEKWTEFDSMCDDPVYWSYSDVQILLKHHYDIFNLIENNLAIDINTLK